MGNQQGPNAPAGWYANDSGHGEKYWDGTSWTGEVRGVNQTQKNEGLSSENETGTNTGFLAYFPRWIWIAVASGVALALLFVFAAPPIISSISSGAGSNSPNLATVQSAIKSVFPKCELKNVNNASPERELVMDMTYPEGNIPETDTFQVCHIHGLDFSAYKNIPKKGQTFCLWGSLKPLDERIAKMNSCLADMESNSQRGYWVVVRKFETKEKALSSLAKIAQDQTKYDFSSPSPVGVLGDVAFTFYGDFDDITTSAVNAAEQTWSRLMDETKSVSLSSIDSKYPSKVISTKNQGLRWDYLNAYNTLSTLTNCSSPLSVSELSYTVGSCGMLDVRVIQADLVTGKCQFLGEWSDANGKTKTGLFSFCTKYKESTFTEGLNYSIRVRVEGTTSYQTRGGWQNSVLTFTAVG